jgi:hypothetical protein
LPVDAVVKHVAASQHNTGEKIEMIKLSQEQCIKQHKAKSWLPKVASTS